MFKSSSTLPFLCTILFILLFLGCNNAPTGEQQNEVREPSKEAEDQQGKKEKVILFFGNSLTAGYGLEEEQSFPSLIQDRIDSLNMDYAVVNAGLSGETTAGGLGRIDWVLKQDINIFVLELGGNDVLRGLDLESTRTNLTGIVERVKTKDPGIKIVIAGMLAPPNMGEDYTDAFGKIYPVLAKQFGAEFIPFLLDGVGGHPEYNQGDGIHPNVEGARILRDNIWKVLEPMLD